MKADTRKERYGFEEFTEMMCPMHEKNLAEIRACCLGLAKYAATLAVRGEPEERFSTLREQISFIGTIWFSADIQKGDPDPTDDLLAAFDSAVATAAEAGKAEPLTDTEKMEILTGLKTQIWCLSENESPYENEFRALADGLRDEWLAEIRTQPSQPEHKRNGSSRHTAER